MSDANDRKDLWLEVGCEELPPAVVRDARAALADAATAALKARRLAPAAAFAFSTPRRLVVVARAVPGRQDGEVRKLVGPPRDRAVDAEGKWTPAALGFLKKYNLAEAAARLEATAKGEYLVAEVPSGRFPAAEVLRDVFPAFLGRLSFPKTMRWPQSPTPFPRPIRWLGCLWGGEVVAAEYAGLAAGALSFGHRVLAPGPADMRAAFDNAGRLEPAALKEFYREKLSVVLDEKDRRRAVLATLRDAGVSDDYFTRADKETRQTLSLVLDTVEMPALVAGRFDPRHLELPAEVVAAALLGYLHLFPIFDADAKLEPRFFAVHNARREAEANVRVGLERVLAARLADASYFWKFDRATPLDEIARALAGVVFAEGAGTLADKTTRLGGLCAALADGLRLNEDEKKNLLRAAALGKADLVSQMVREKEFTHLQGTMGRLCALAQGEDGEVAAAIEEHYWPAGAEDRLPVTKLGRILALADRLDTLVVLFTAGHKPTGAKDPFALRRAAVGVCRLLLGDDRDLFGALPLQNLVAVTAAICEAPRGVEEEVGRFILERLKQIFLEQGFRDDMVEAVVFPAPEVAQPLTSPRDQLRRLDALKRFYEDRAAYVKLALAFKRPINIVRQGFEKCLDIGRDVDEGLLREPEELELWREFERGKEGVAAALVRRNYDDALARLAALRPAVDKFFDAVMVMVDEPKVRGNRLALMRMLADLFLLFADFTRLRGEEEYA